jgi:hypothetical protein
MLTRRDGKIAFRFLNQVACPTGGYWRAGDIVWLSPQEYNNMNDPFVKNSLEDVREADLKKQKDLKRITSEENGEAQPPEHVDRVLEARRRLREKRQADSRLDRMAGDREVK